MSLTRCRPSRGAHWRRPRARREAGAILIVALGVLTLLAVLGATFAQLMSLEQKAAVNYRETQHMDLLTSSALDMVIAQLHDHTNRRSWTSYESMPWKFFLRDENDVAHGRARIDDPRVGDWITYSELAGKRFRFKTKVIDCASQINLNGRQDTLARMLDHLGEAIEKSERLQRDGRTRTNPFYTRPNRGGQRVRGIDVLLYRQRLEGQRFQSKSQLRKLIGDENYEIVKDYLTCWSWEDPYTYAPVDGMNEVPDLTTGVTAVVPTLGGRDGQSHPAASDEPRLQHEPRHPININTAPEEVLIACIQGLAGRRVFPYSNLGVLGGALQAIDDGAHILGERILFGQEEVRNVFPRAVYVYSQEFDYQLAKRLAQRIITQRKEPSKVFRTWRTNDMGRPGFEDFIDSLEDAFFPSPGNVQVVDPDLPQDRSIDGRIKNGGASPIGRLWAKGNVQGAARSVFRQKGLPVHDRFAWYYEMMKSILKANANPNTRINRHNPNAPAFIPVDKSDLVWLDRSTGGTIIKKGHTTEFCFDSMGRYEITTLGEMVDLNKLSRVRTVVGDGSRETGNIRGYYPFRSQIRTVVQVFDVLRHTNQKHFEKTFQVSGRSSREDRKYVVTWPEPMAALTELYSQGSVRDGRVELAGQLDGQRLEMPLAQRFQFAGRHSDVLLEHSFMIRDAQSISRLRQALRTGGTSVFGDEVTDALRDVLDADYSRYRRNYREYYRLREMQNLGVFAGTEARWGDLLVGREERGTDLFPDGVHSSILRMPHLGSRLLVLPARQKIGDLGSGGGNVRYGASGRGTRGQNIYGNVPYYNGGLGFWVKFDFNGDDPVFSGLIGCTQVIEDVKPSSQVFEGSEGTQFFIFKNSLGQLRIVRLYYHQAFPEFSGGSDGGGAAAGESLVPWPDTGTSGANASDPNNPLIEHLDPQKWISRSDILLDISHIRAHEWHHVAVEWSDQNINRPIRLYLDFEEVQEAVPRRAQQVVDGTANSWVRLNERQPRDGLQIVGIVRNQQVEDAGIFKFFTNMAQAPGGLGIQPVALGVKRILANATIDDLITFQGTFASAKTYYGGRGQPGYFTNQVGEYANVFEVPVPAGVDQVTLRSFDWTSYYPTTYTDSQTNSPAQALNNPTPISAEVTFSGPSLPPQAFEPWREPMVDNFVAGRVAMPQNTGIQGESVKVVYKFRMSGARSQGGRTIGGVVQTPVIDDVTLSYFLPSPKILLQEKEDE